MVKVKKEGTASSTTEKNEKAAAKQEDTNEATSTSEPPSNDILKQLIVKLVPQVDLNRTGVKQFTKKLAAELGGGSATLKNLQSRSDFIKETLSDVINSMEDDDDDDDDEPILKAVSKKSSGSATKGAKAKKPFKSNLATKTELSEALSSFLGKGKSMARTEIVRELWDYIKENKLQNPENKREIILDDKMKAVFGVDTFTMFTMNKYIGAHVYPFKPVDLTVNTYIKRNKPGTSSATKRKKGGDEDGSNDGGTPKKRKKKPVGMQPPYRLSAELTAIVGKEILPRPQVISALWNYIKTHNLQDPKDKREIFCDDKLKAVMGGQPKITMFTLNKMLTPHLLEKMDRSQYVHEDSTKIKKDGDDEEEDEHHDDDDEDEEDAKAAADDVDEEAGEEVIDHPDQGADNEEGKPKKAKMQVKNEEDDA